MKKEEKKEKPPVVVVLGHVDHGKSSLLEAIKGLKITEKEAGGITQHIGAYMVSHQGKEITFIDTPGHEAFFAMRSRGARVADIGILVVAADESVKEQTKEAINHLKEAEMPFFVAISKTDKKNIDIERVKQDLSKEGVFVESYGGNIPCVNISAKDKTGIEELLEVALLLAEVEEVDGKKKKKEEKTEGAVIEVQRDPKKGVTATLLVKEGILRKGDAVATESSYGRIRIMEDFMGEKVEKVGPSTPVSVTGLKGCPGVGESFFVFQELEEAKKLAFGGKKEEKSNSLASGEKCLNIILKADVTGSLEAIKESLEKFSWPEISVNIIRADIGNVTESDIECSKATGAKILAFGAKADKAAEKMAIRERVEIRSFNVIYELLEEVKKAAEEMLEPEVVRTETGKVKILAIFRTQGNRQILGGKVLEGEVKKGDLAEIKREDEKVGEGKLINIKKEEKDMERIRENEEFGMLLESRERAREEDIIVLYKEEKKKKKLE